MHAPSVAPCATTTADGQVLTASEPLAQLLGVPVDNLVGRRLDEFATGPDDVDSVRACLLTVSDGGGAGRARMLLTTADGREISTYLVVTPLPNDSVTVVVMDETGRVDAETELARSQRRWLALLRNSTDIVFAVDDDGTLTFVTSALPERLGWAMTEVMGREGLGFIHLDDRRAAMRAWLDVSRRLTKQVHQEARLIHRDGSTMWARLVITDLRDDPDVSAVIGNVTDISEQKKDQARQRLEESRFDARFDRSRLPQAVVEADGTYRAVNDAFCALLRRPRAELLGIHPSAITHADDTGAADLALASLVRGDLESAQVDRILADVDGNPVPVSIDVTLLRDADGRPEGCAASLHDLRPLRDSEQARSELQTLFDLVATRSPDFITLHDADGEMVYGSPAGVAMFGEASNGTTQDMLDLIHPDDLDGATANWTAVQTQPESRSHRFRARSVTGQWLWVEQTSTNLLDTPVAAIVSTIRDITRDVEAADAQRISEARYRAIAETAEEGILVIAQDGQVTFANSRIASILGLHHAEIEGLDIAAILSGRSAPGVVSRLFTSRTNGSRPYEVAYRRPDGRSSTLRVTVSPMPDLEDLEQGSLAMVSDITEQRRQERELWHAAQHDELTGLLNRSMLMDELGRRLADGTAVLFVDLDHFKDVNDGNGHTAGDTVLREVARRLRTTLRLDDIVARFGGDEFVAVLTDVDEATAMDAARRLLDVLSTPCPIGRHTVRIGATIGVALSPAKSAEDLLRFADAAMYAAKASGRGRVRLFDRQLADQAEERYALGAELLTALSTDELEMHYQPVIDVTTGEVAGVEALVRWHHPTRGTISPSRFVALAELSASSTDLDRWVIRRTMRDIAELKADWSMPEAATVAINLSGQSLTDGLDGYIIDCADEAGLEPSVVTLEITENTVMADKDIAIEILQRLRDHGFGIAVDDFGTGYSSMAYLRDLPITVLKIDRGFVRGIPDDQHSLAIVTALIELARSLDLTVVAEGVETPAHLQALRERGCSYAQGWLWSPAVPPDELRRLQMFETRFAVD